MKAVGLFCGIIFNPFLYHLTCKNSTQNIGAFVIKPFDKPKSLK